MNDKNLLKTYANWSNQDIATSAAQQAPGESRDTMLHVLRLRTAAHYAAVSNGTMQPCNPLPVPQKPFVERMVAGIRMCVILLLICFQCCPTGA